MATPVRASEQDLSALAAIVSKDRDDVPAQGLPTSLMIDLWDQIGCDFLSFRCLDTDRQMTCFDQDFPIGCDGDTAYERTFWAHYRGFVPCSYPERSGDLRTVTKTSDFYSAHSFTRPAFTATASIPWGWNTPSGCACPPDRDRRCG